MKFKVLDSFTLAPGGDLIVTLEREDFVHGDGTPHSVEVTVPRFVLDGIVAGLKAKAE